MRTIEEGLCRCRSILGEKIEESEKLVEGNGTTTEVQIKTTTFQKSEIDSIFLEAETLKTLKHDNIVKVHNCLALKNMQVAIIMEYLEGG